MDPESTTNNIQGGQQTLSLFKGGNAQVWAAITTRGLPAAIGLILQTLSPAVYASMIELLGDNSAFSGEALTLTPKVVSSKTLESITATMVFTSQALVNPSASPEDVAHDESFLTNRIIQKAGGVNLPQKFVEMDVQKGSITVSITIKVS